MDTALENLLQKKDEVLFSPSNLTPRSNITQSKKYYHAAIMLTIE